MANAPPEGPVIIAGAGIAGLTAALCVRAAGYHVLVVERAQALAEIGAGLQISPNACHVLDALGVLERLKSSAVTPEAVRIRSGTSGRDLARVPLGPDCLTRHGAPYYVVHRADLQKALLDTVGETTGIELRLSTEIASVENTGTGPIRCRVSSGAHERWISAAALVGADGVWSKTRSLVPGHGKARFSGRTAYRTTIPAGSVSWEYTRDTGLWLGPSAHLVHYPLRGGRELNLVALIDEDWTEETWSAPAHYDSLAPAFENWAPEVRDLLQRPDAWTKWALCAVDAGARWTHGRIALIGDAAHAMLPFVAQGAAMAIEDAAVLGAVLATGDQDISQSLEKYHALRASRVQKIQKTAERNARLYHLHGPAAIGRDTMMRFMRSANLADRMDWIYGWKPPGRARSERRRT